MNSDTAAGTRAAGPEIFQLMLAYKKTALIRAGIELDVFGRLASGYETPEQVAREMRLNPRGVRLLLDALGALGLVERGQTGYRLTDLAATHLVPGRPGYLGDMAKVLASEWEWDAMWRLPEAVSRGGPVVSEHAETPGYRYWTDFARHVGTVAEPTARLLADRLDDWAAGRDGLRILDVACGHGIYGYILAQRHAEARVWSLDWPNVLPIAQKHAARLGVAERVSTISGDMFDVPFGGPYDIVLITNVLHHFSERRALQLLRRAAAATVPGGKIGVVGFTVDEGPAEANADAYLFSILMLVWTAEGESHSVAAYRRMLAGAGYSDLQIHRQAALPLRVLLADKT